MDHNHEMLELLRKIEKSNRQKNVTNVIMCVFMLAAAASCVFIGGFGFAISKWASGIPFDSAHCVGNFCRALVLFKPLRELVEKLYRKMKR